jgi:hypothetical protein
VRVERERVQAEKRRNDWALVQPHTPAPPPHPAVFAKAPHSQSRNGENLHVHVQRVTGAADGADGVRLVAVDERLA